MISQVTDGYWIFYEGPTYTKPDHADYWRWFTWANKAIAKGDFDVQHEPRKTPNTWSQLELFKNSNVSTSTTAPQAASMVTKYPTVKLRGPNLLMLACKKGQPVAVKLAHHPLTKHRTMLAWEIRNPVGDKNGAEKIAFGTFPYAKKGTVEFTPEKDGIYLLGASAGHCCWSVESSNVPLGMYAHEKLGLMRGAERLYFHVPAALKQFTITIRGSGAETVRANIFDPDGKQVATAQTIPDQRGITIRVSTGKQDVNKTGSVWSLQTTQADKGWLEDNSIRLDARLSPTLSFIEDQVFKMAK